MPFKRRAHAVRLEFSETSLTTTNLSGVALYGDWMWVVGDESASVERLHRLPPVGRELLRYGESASFALADVLDLPGGADDEADLEGMALSNGWLWLVGSHGLKRKNAKADKGDARNTRRLGRMALDSNRRLLARIPIETGADGQPRPVRKAADGRCALRLHGDSQRNALTKLLQEDDLLAPFLTIPGKDNGFDIEGLAVDGPRLVLGLRGPVLRGWAMLLEVAVVADGDWLQLAPLDDSGTLLRKHLLQLDGFGVRDLTIDGAALLILAGPTMVLDGDVRLYRWPAARQALAQEGEPTRFHDGIEAHTELPHSKGHDRAEAIARLPPGLLGKLPGWLVLYDSPSQERHPQPLVVFGDVLTGT